MPPVTVSSRMIAVVALHLRYVTSALALTLLATDAAFAQPGRPIDPGISLPINPGGGGGGGNTGGITLPIGPIGPVGPVGPINPILPINPGGILPTGPRIVTSETKKVMRQVLTDIQTGEYAKSFILENAAGAPSITSRRRINAESQIEVVGGKLRAMMPWIAANKLVDQSKN